MLHASLSEEYHEDYCNPGSIFNFWVQVKQSKLTEDIIKDSDIQDHSSSRFYKSHPFWVLPFQLIHCQPSLCGRGA